MPNLSNVRDSIDPVFWYVQDGAAVTGLIIAAASLVAVNTTGNAIYDPIGSIVVGNLLGMVCLLLELWANNIFLLICLLKVTFHSGYIWNILTSWIRLHNAPWISLWNLEACFPGVMN